ncbi:DUF4270 family protein [Ancylomarina subtilis]|nr:DUF4270 family protein [Ancylomarina subtilis]
MKKIKYFAFLTFLAFFSSCNSDVFEEHEIGENLIDKSTEVLLIDTFTVDSYTVKLDSIVTSGGSSARVGQYQDDFFGKVRSEFYGILDYGGGFELKKDIEDAIIPVEFDSLVFITYFDKNFYGDTLKEQSISIHRVTEEIDFADGTASFFGHNEFDYDDKVLGELTFKARPYRTKNERPYNLRIPMGDELGQKIISMAMEANDTLSESKKWKRFFEGIVLKPGEDDDAAMLTFKTGDTLMKMRVYYSNLEGENTDVVLYHDFPVKSDPFNFSNYTSDKSSTPQDLGRIVERTDELSSELTDNLAFVQGGVGFITKIKIPFIENLNTLGLTGGILKAELVFYPMDGSYDSKLFKLPNSAPFNIYKTNADNMALEAVINPTINGPVASNYNYNYDNPDESFYSLDITSYVNEILMQGQEYDDALLLSFPLEGLGNSMERIVIENDPKSDFRIRLKTTYVVQK